MFNANDIFIFKPNTHKRAHPVLVSFLPVLLSVFTISVQAQYKSSAHIQQSHFRSCGSKICVEITLPVAEHHTLFNTLVSRDSEIKISSTTHPEQLQIITSKNVNIDLNESLIYIRSTNLPKTEYLVDLVAQTVTPFPAP